MNTKLSSKGFEKYISYQPDGTGRDGYINLNSGGFSRFMPSKVITPHYVIIKPEKENKQFRDLRKTSWSFKYKSDGSGRDSYVLSGSGGLQNDWRPNLEFGETLRGGFVRNERPSTTFKILNPNKNNNEIQTNDVKSDDFLNVRYVSREELLMSNKLKKIQMDVTKRLYTSNQKSHSKSNSNITQSKTKPNLNIEMINESHKNNEKLLPKLNYNTSTNLNSNLASNNKLSFNKLFLKNDSKILEDKINDKILNKRFSKDVYESSKLIKSLTNHINSNKNIVNKITPKFDPQHNISCFDYDVEVQKINQTHKHSMKKLGFLIENEVIKTEPKKEESVKLRIINDEKIDLMEKKKYETFKTLQVNTYIDQLKNYNELKTSNKVRYFFPQLQTN